MVNKPLVSTAARWDPRLRWESENPFAARWHALARSSYSRPIARCRMRVAGC